MFNVVLTGPESTGKTEICRFLAKSYHADFIPEYARDYVASLNRPYTFKDVEQIARVQVEQFWQSQDKDSAILFFDTFLIITKVWFREVYGMIPDWIDSSLADAGIDLFLLCYYDIEWVPDPLRENPHPRRAYLYEAYVREIEQLGTAYEVIRGTGITRFENAKMAVGKHYSSYID